MGQAVIYRSVEARMKPKNDLLEYIRENNEKNLEFFKAATKALFKVKADYLRETGLKHEIQ